MNHLKATKDPNFVRVRRSSLRILLKSNKQKRQELHELREFKRKIMASDSGRIVATYLI